jgi:hypothetical protein
MDISIGSYTFRMEILILIVVIAWIMFGHMLCSCCTMGLREGLETMADTLVDNKDIKDKAKKILSDSATKKEGFVGSNNLAYGPEFSVNTNPGYIMRPDTWAQPTLTYSKGTTPDAGIQSILNRPEQPVPLPEGELDMFATTEFKPECCPNSFSNSTGCACMTQKQYKMLIDRGGNNVPYSEY